MLRRFIENIESKQLVGAGQRVLLAVSGGIDSMVMLDLFRRAGYTFGLVHCNFKLRGKESDEDEIFVRKYAELNGIEAFFTSFDTRCYAQENGISIEMAARDLRYDYFERVRRTHAYDLIATAHHQDDVLETFFLNLTRKTGIRGLTGIREKSGFLIRPLLFADRANIEAYARQHRIPSRHDSSNEEVVYRRNFIRHRILPLFSELTPSFKKTMLASIENLKDTEEVYVRCIEDAKNRVCYKEGDRIRISIAEVKKSPYPKVLLFELLQEYGFNAVVSEEVFRSLNQISGKQFYSNFYRLVKDRAYLYIVPREEVEPKVFYIDEQVASIDDPISLELERLSADGLQLCKDRTLAFLDRDKLQFPLLIRRWKKGDYFRPLGMRGFKKISDFFIDQKVPQHEKESAWILCSGENVVWIIGHRIDDRYKITDATRNVLSIRVSEPQE